MRSSINRASASPMDVPAGTNFARRPHHIAHTMTIRIAVDAAQGALAIDAAGASSQPARCCWSSASVSVRHASIASPSVRTPASRSLGTSAEKMCAVATASPSAEWRSLISTPSQDDSPSSVKLARLGWTTWASSRVSSVRGGRNGDIGALAFALEHREIEAERVSDQHGLAHEGEQLRPDLLEGRRVRDLAVIDMMDRDGRCRNRFVRAERGAGTGRRIDPPSHQPHRRDFDDPGLRRIKAGRLAVDDHRVERDERCRAADGCHQICSAAPAAS